VTRLARLSTQLGIRVLRVGISAKSSGIGVASFGTLPMRLGTTETCVGIAKTP
jgi:hypothetical protein